jgi:hypothetical protein
MVVLVLVHVLACVLVTSVRFPYIHTDRQAGGGKQEADKRQARGRQEASKRQARGRQEAGKRQVYKQIKGTLYIALRPSSRTTVVMVCMIPRYLTSPGTAVLCMPEHM